MKIFKKEIDASSPLERNIMEFVQTVLWVIVIVGVLRAFFFESFVIPSSSMVPTLEVGDYLWVSKYSYGYSHFSFPFSLDLFRGRLFASQPKRGDVVVFRFTKDTSIDYIKRVIGLPGDRIQVIDGRLYLNGERVPVQSCHSYDYKDRFSSEISQGKACEEDLPLRSEGQQKVHPILKLTQEGFQNNTPEYVVPPGYLFMMGDNRDNSADSRFMGDGPKDLGFVPQENLIGKAQRIFFSVQKDHPMWAFWYWPFEIRWGRILQGIE